MLHIDRSKECRKECQIFLQKLCPAQDNIIQNATDLHNAAETRGTCTNNGLLSVERRAGKHSACVACLAVFRVVSNISIHCNAPVLPLTCYGQLQLRQVGSFRVAGFRAVCSAGFGFADQMCTYSHDQDVMVMVMVIVNLCYDRDGDHNADVASSMPSC